MQISLGPQWILAAQHYLDEAVESHFASRLFAKDHTLWGKAAEAEAGVRLGWVEDPARWLSLVEELLAFRMELAGKGVNSVILCGMGGSSLAPEVMAKQAGVPLHIIDSTHPDQLSSVVTGDLSQSVVVVSSKSGGTLETDSQRRIFESAFREQGIDPLERIVVVTDPDSPLHHQSKETGYRVFLGDATIGGRFSALSPFGLVPAVLAGVDVATILHDASGAYEALRLDVANNPGLLLGAAIVSRYPEVNKILLKPQAGLPGIGDWIEQLVAESTGKQGQGLLPVVECSLTGLFDAITVGGVLPGIDVGIEATLGEQFLLWEVATVFACQILRVNPFDQPNVESAKLAAKELLDSPSQSQRDEMALEGFSLWSPRAIPSKLTTLPEVITWWRSLLGPRSFGAVCVFGDQGHIESWEAARKALESATNRPFTLGFGPRFLHSTGQLHKGGPSEGVFLQIIQTPEAKLAIPGRNFDLGTLMLAQAHGDAKVLADAGLSVLSVTATAPQLKVLWEALGI